MTREYTHPDVLTTGVAEGWADPETDPSRIDWAERQARAAIPFDVVDGRPVNPCTRLGYPAPAVRRGRNQLGHWGEALAADALVIAHKPTGHRWVLMVERRDGHGWAVPGGHVDPGETAVEAAARELEEETTLTVPGAVWQEAPPRYVPDPRASGEAWMVTVLCTARLWGVKELPTVRGQDDARRAVWVHACRYGVLTWNLDAQHRGRVFPAHVDMLRDALGE